MIHRIWIDILHFIGADDTTGLWYGFWSGFAGDIPLFGAAWVLYRKYTCNAKWCARLNCHAIEGTQYRACHRHHPNPLGPKMLPAKNLRQLCTGSTVSSVTDSVRSSHDNEAGEDHGN